MTMVRINWLPHYHAYRHLDVWESGTVAQYISPVLTSSCSNQCFTTGHGKSVRSWRSGSSGSIPHGEPIELFLVPASAPQRLWYVLSCLVVHIKKPCCSPGGGNRFPLLLSEWSFTICLMPYNCKYYTRH